MKNIMKVRSLWKQYTKAQLKQQLNLRDQIFNLPKNIFASKKEKFWALQDINFELKEGEIMGIVGPNGAGKSTLLKIISRITLPTKGEVLLRGKVSSLLEVGTGFHPDLTGRENIYLNGSILGMKKRDVAMVFDEIVDFSGTGTFLDTQLKFFSTGMQLRLAFSVATHLVSEIILLDEVLAVGDVEFQQKCLQKIKSLSQEKGRAILFVSHNEVSLKEFCTKGMLIDDGKCLNIGSIDSCLSDYKTLNILFTGDTVQ